MHISFLGSTGAIYIFEFLDDDLEKLPGRFHQMEQQVTGTKPTKILELSPSHVAVVGQDKEDEGEVITLADNCAHAFIYNHVFCYGCALETGVIVKSTGS